MNALSLFLFGVLFGDTSATQPVKLDTTATGEDDRFGHSVLLRGGIAFVGAIGDDGEALDTGAVHVFEPEGTKWRRSQKLVPEEVGTGDWFGFSMDGDERHLVVGAPRDDTLGGNAGAVYVFSRIEHGWRLTSRLLPKNGRVGARFGHAVSLSGDRLAVGAWGDDTRGVRAGAVLIFTLTEEGWVEEAKLTASDARPGDDFGRALSLDGDWLLVGKEGDSSAGVNRGAAYLYERTSDGWVEKTKLRAPDGAQGDHFGGSVCLTREILVIGAPGHDARGSSSGAAYVFGHLGNRWAFLERLAPRDGRPGAQFGTSIKIQGGRVVVGASNDSALYEGAGAVYQFGRRQGVWHQLQKFVVRDEARSEGLGWSVDCDGDTLLVGARHADMSGANSGAVYAFGLDPRFVRASRRDGTERRPAFASTGGASR